MQKRGAAMATRFLDRQAAGLHRRLASVTMTLIKYAKG